MTDGLAGFRRVEIRKIGDLRKWFRDNASCAESIWVVTWKKGGGPHVPYADVRDEALCFGWIDSRHARLDADRSMLLVSPRRPGGAWSAINKTRVAALEAEGRMTARGRAKIDAARAEGSWSILDDVDRLVEPPDLKRALGERPKARGFWDKFPPSAKRGILEWIQHAKKPETRARRIAETVRLADVDVRANTPAARGK